MIRPGRLRGAILAVSFVAAPLASAAPDPARYKLCYATFSSAVRSGVFTDVERSGRLGTVFVGPTYFKLSFQDKRALVDAASCAFTKGDDQLCAQFILRHWQTGQTLGRYENCRLKVD